MFLFRLPNKGISDPHTSTQVIICMCLVVCQWNPCSSEACCFLPMKPLQQWSLLFSVNETPPAMKPLQQWSQCYPFLLLLLVVVLVATTLLSHLTVLLVKTTQSCHIHVNLCLLISFFVVDIVEAFVCFWLFLVGGVYILNLFWSATFYTVPFNNINKYCLTIFIIKETK